MLLSAPLSRRLLAHEHADLLRSYSRYALRVSDRGFLEARDGRDLPNKERMKCIEVWANEAPNSNVTGSTAAMVRKLLFSHMHRRHVVASEEYDATVGRGHAHHMTQHEPS
jgi:hypothetical protein